MEITKDYLNKLTYKIVGCCIEVHKVAGPGLYEDLYHKCLEKEFQLQGINYRTELQLPLNYKGFEVDCKLKCDFLIEDAIVLEIKSISEIIDIHRAQTMNYMNLLKVHKSILVNFNVFNLYRNGTETFVSRNFHNLPEK